MRCLNCGEKGIALNAENCPNCSVHLPSLLRGCLSPGTLLSHDTYRIDYPIGRGGFGITYRAFDLNLERAVAIKEFFPQEYALREQTTGLLKVPNTQKQGIYHRGLERFLREGRLLARLDCPSIVKIFNAFEERGTAYLSMELVEGMTLRDELDRQPEHKLDPARVTAIISTLVDALDHVHQQQVYHLDISPDNVMIGNDGKIVLIDFGASRQGLGGQTTQAYKEAYAPPEVLNGEGMGAESDIFELGMMLCELLTGELPASAISRLTSVITAGRDSWEPRGLAEPWGGLVSRAIQLKQQERPQKILDWWTFNTVPVTKTRDAQTPSPQEQQVSSPQGKTDQEPLPPPLQKIPAGFWLRFAADLIDRIIIVIGSLILTIVLRMPFTMKAMFFIYMILGVIYAPTMDSSPKQGTIGKLMMGIVVTDLSGKKVDFQKALYRHISKIFSYLTLLVGFVMTGATIKKQALHDRITKCLVVKKY